MNTSSANLEHLVLTTDYVIMRPPGPNADGAMMELLLTASGANRLITFSADLIGESDPGLTIPEGETYVVTLRYDAVQDRWYDIRIVGDSLWRFV